MRFQKKKENKMEYWAVDEVGQCFGLVTELEHEV